MRRLVRLAWLAWLGSLVGGCSFSPAGLPVDIADAPRAEPDVPEVAVDAAVPDAPLPDAPRPPDAPRLPDAATADAPIELPDGPPPDAAPPDARPDAAPPDGPPDPCPVPALELTVPGTASGTLGGPTRYTPTCGSPSTTGPELFYRVDVPTAPSADLVIDVKEVGLLDSVIDVTATCVGFGFGGSGACANTGAPGAGEVVIVPYVSAGRRYVAIDTYGTAGGGFSVTAFLRAIVGPNAICDPTLATSRCMLDSFCVDKNNDGTARCDSALPKVSNTNSGGLEEGCGAAVKVSADTAVLGTVSSPSDVDVVEITPPSALKLRAVLDDGAGGCPVDARLELVTGADCVHAATTVASDDDSGLGPCPFLDTAALTAGKKYWLRARLGPGATLPAKADYFLTIDLH